MELGTTDTKAFIKSGLPEKCQVKSEIFLIRKPKSIYMFLFEQIALGGGGGHYATNI